jgi:hypothetical protein
LFQLVDGAGFKPIVWFTFLHLFARTLIHSFVSFRP